MQYKNENTYLMCKSQELFNYYLLYGLEFM